MIHCYVRIDVAIQLRTEKKGKMISLPFHIRYVASTMSALIRNEAVLAVCRGETKRTEKKTQKQQKYLTLKLTLQCEAER